MKILRSRQTGKQVLVWWTKEMYRSSAVKGHTGCLSLLLAWCQPNCLCPLTLSFSWSLFFGQSFQKSLPNPVGLGTQKVDCAFLVLGHLFLPSHSGWDCLSGWIRQEQRHSPEACEARLAETSSLTFYISSSVCWRTGSSPGGTNNGIKAQRHKSCLEGKERKGLGDALSQC